MKNAIDIKIVCLEHMLMGINHHTNNFRFDCPEREAYETLRRERAQKIENEIAELHRQKAPMGEGPFLIRHRAPACSGVNKDRHLYIARMDTHSKTPHKQDARIWKTAAGAEKALAIYGKRFGYRDSFEIVPRNL